MAVGCSRCTLTCNEGARLRQGTETLEATGTPTAAQSSSDGDLLSLRSHSSYLLCFINSRVKLKSI